MLLQSGRQELPDDSRQMKAHLAPIPARAEEVKFDSL
jgi:hypothetical protein